ncbi:MAG: SPASM domain-containing protein, partial [Gammaproteobacteria bacterium]|nr:SPASM domain-containing protein [Gammaproteobacteria bacterium]
ENVSQIGQMLDLSVQLGADFVELATTQYYGWAFLNRDALMPSREQVLQAEADTNEFRETRMPDNMKVYYVIPDYFENRPKPCMNGWGSIFLVITPDGTALPCHAARQLPGIEFPNVRDYPVADIWNNSGAFNHFRGYEWMKEPCRSCAEKTKDFGGCRCQAYMLTGDMYAADPVCEKSPDHRKITEATALSSQSEHHESPLIFRNTRNSKAGLHKHS